MKKISEERFYELVGLITLARHYRIIQDSLFNSFKKVTGQEASERFWDYLYDDNIEEALISHLPYDCIKVVWNKKRKKKKK